MRLIQEIPHDTYKISVFSWNNKYIIKFEYGHFEQTFKISEWDLTSEEEIPQVIELLISGNIKDVFSKMNHNLAQALDNV